jgi:hypothetical protein
VLLTGRNGAAWHEAARQVRRALGVPLGAITVGGADVQDLSAAWQSAYGVDSDGAVLVRADGHIAWRSAGAAADATATLEQVVARVLALNVEDRRDRVAMHDDGVSRRAG